MPYTLQTPAGPIVSDVPGQLGGHRRLKVYGRLNCRSALRWIERGHYVEHRVFFADEAAAKACGYRPCAVCMPDEYQAWIEANRRSSSTVSSGS